ncbi:MAG: bifunctional 5,10-methylenetetrahydrofolate dehydrogenase/5,10-methenyltetrahydrofolate cyclohydrolase [Minisyncoccia bacterium]
MILIDGRKIREEILEEVKKEVAELSFTPVFCDVLVGENKASIQYIQMKKKNAESAGIDFHQANFPASISTEKLIEEINIINKIPRMCGIIIQLPLPEHIDRQKVLDSISPELDVDCLGAIRSKKFYNNYNDEDIGPPAALSSMVVLDSLKLDLKNKKIIVLGQGILVGTPVTALLHYRNLSPTIVTDKTEDKEKIIKEADVIISGIGKGKYIDGGMIKEGAVLIDAGTSESEGGPPGARAGIVGDVDLESVKGVASYVSQVPGGVGPVTIAILLSNVLKVAKKLKNV